MDAYSFNNPDSVERNAILSFLSIAQQRIHDAPSRLPFKAMFGHMVISWLRGLLDQKPSDFAKAAAAELDIRA